MKVSVVIPVYNGARTLAATLQSLAQQSMSRHFYEIVVVDDGSTDGSAQLAADFGARVIVQRNAGAPSARNRGIQAASGTWIAFTDSDCVCSRTWLTSLVLAAEREPNSIGAAGKTTGLESRTPAARFVDLMGGLDPARSLRHPRFPFAPTSNALYRAAYLRHIGGFDVRYATYDACDLHTRLLRAYDGPFAYEPRALVMHRHRPTWRGYWRQQFFYGVGYAQFLIAHRRECRWNVSHQFRAGADVLLKAAAAAIPGQDDGALLRRGWFVRAAAQQAGFLCAYYSPRERRRW